MQNYKTDKDAVLFAIDVSESMLENTPKPEGKKAGRDSATTAALKCAWQLMQQRIISNPNDMMGILLFGTQQSKFQGDDEDSKTRAYPHCYLLTDLDIPAAADVKRLRNLVQDEEESTKLLIPSSEPVSMGNVLFCANQIFTTRAPNFSSRRLFLVTDNDNPHADNKALRSTAAVRAKDLYDLGVVIELFPISRPGHGFNRKLFYDDIVYNTLPLDPEAPTPLISAAKSVSTEEGISLLESLLSSINSKATPRRAAFSLPFEIGPGLKIGVKGYVMIKRQTKQKSCFIWTGGEKLQVALGSTTQMADDTARAVEKAEIRKAYKYGGESISFTEDEMKAVKYFGDPVIRIIGFKPIDMLPIWASYRPPYFIYPSETDFIGSTRVFSALQQKMLKAQKFAVCWFIARRNASPTLAAAYAGAEKINDHKEQEMPPGLWIHPLPFADDIRPYPETELVRAPDSLVDQMRVVIQQLQLPKAVYDPKKYPNPDLQWFYRVLQSLALEEDVPEKPEDKTIPRYRQIDKRAGEMVIEWGQELESQFRAWQAAKSKMRDADVKDSSHKRAAGSESTQLAKRVKTSQATAPPASSAVMSDEDMKKHWQQERLSKLTVAVLSEWLKHKKINASGKKKPELIEDVEGYFESR